jgi:hypothetical protein
MDLNILTQLGVGAVVIILVLKEVFTFIKKSRIDSEDDSRRTIIEIKNMIQDLHKMHDVRDDDGRPVWYFKNSLTEAITDLSRNIYSQSVVLEKMMHFLSRAENDTKDQTQILNKILQRNGGA